MSTRRNFLKTLVAGIVTAPAIGKALLAQGAIIEPVFIQIPDNYARRETCQFSFDPTLYMGELRWHNCPDNLTPAT